MKKFPVKLVWFTSIYVLVFTALCLTKLFLQYPVMMSMYLLGLGLVLVKVFSALHQE